MTSSRSRPEPSVSVVVETVTTTLDRGLASGAVDELRPTLEALATQSYPRELLEVVVVVQQAHRDTDGAAIERQHPWVRVAAVDSDNYFAAKNEGARVASGDLVAYVDGDCVPDVHWLERLVARFEPGVDAVAGCIRYAGASRWSRSMSIIGFAHVMTGPSGDSTGFNLSNVAFRRELLSEFRFDTCLRRNGGCTLLFHQLRAAGKRILYASDALVAHGADEIAGFGIVRKHFHRGVDSVDVYRRDDTAVLGGTRLFRRLGPVALLAITARRILVDLKLLVRQRAQIGVPPAALPYVAATGVGIRLTELAGMLTAVARPKPAVVSSSST